MKINNLIKKQNKDTRNYIDRVLFEYDYLLIDRTEAVKRIAEILGIDNNDVDAWI